MTTENQNTQTKKLIDKYKTIVSSLLNCDPDRLKFFTEVEVINISGKGNTYKKVTTNKWVEVGEIYEYKIFEDADAYTDVNNWKIGRQQLVLIGDDGRENIISNWKLYQMPHCCAYIVSCNVNVYGLFRNKRIGTVLNQLRQEIGKLLGYSAMLCTDIEKNTHQRKLLKNNGWSDIHSIKNKRTGNKVFLSVIDLK